MHYGKLRVKVLSGCNKDYYLRLLKLRLFEKRIIEAVVFFRQGNFDPILIKGWSAAQLYPEPCQRYFSDIDLIISPNEYENAIKYSGNFDDEYLIDLHNGARQLDSLSFENLYSNSKLVKCGETNIRVLRPEDHLRVLCVHWLIDGGAKRNNLWDIYYAVENRPSDFDWDRCLNVVSETRKRWIICTIGLAKKYLGLNLENTPLADEKIEIPRWFIKALEKEWESGVLLRPLQYCLNDKRELWRQIKKRIPPNPIQATIDMEGEFDDKSRIKYQIGDIFFRLKPSIIRLRNSILYGNK